MPSSVMSASVHPVALHAMLATPEATPEPEPPIAEPLSRRSLQTRERGVDTSVQQSPQSTEVGVKRGRTMGREADLPGGKRRKVHKRGSKKPKARKAMERNREMPELVPGGDLTQNADAGPENSARSVPLLIAQTAEAIGTLRAKWNTELIAHFADRVSSSFTAVPVSLFNSDDLVSCSRRILAGETVQAVQAFHNMLYQMQFACKVTR